MPLSGKEKRHLRSLAHHLDPVVLTGQAGVNETLLAKVALELENHELIKVRVGDGPLETAEAALALEAGAGAELVQVIGRIVVLFRRRAKDPEVLLPGEKAPRPKKVLARLPPKRSRPVRKVKAGRKDMPGKPGKPVRPDRPNQQSRPARKVRREPKGNAPGGRGPTHRSE